MLPCFQILLGIPSLNTVLCAHTPTIDYAGLHIAACWAHAGLKGNRHPFTLRISAIRCKVKRGRGSPGACASAAAWRCLVCIVWKLGDWMSLSEVLKMYGFNSLFAEGFGKVSSTNQWSWLHQHHKIKNQGSSRSNIEKSFTPKQGYLPHTLQRPSSPPILSGWPIITTPYPSDSLEIPQWCPVLVAPFEGSPKQSTGMECVVKMEEPQMMQG